MEVMAITFFVGLKVPDRLKKNKESLAIIKEVKSQCWQLESSRYLLIMLSTAVHFMIKPMGGAKRVKATEREVFFYIIIIISTDMQ